jgi:hypothetical protein
MFNSLVSMAGRVEMGNVDEDDLQRLAVLKDRMTADWENVMPYDILQQQPRNVTDDLFFENLITKTSRAAMQIQGAIVKGENSKKDELLTRLASLKKIGDLTLIMRIYAKSKIT